MSTGHEPCWVPAIAVRAIHHEQMLEHGGLQGIRSATALEAALARPRPRWEYSELNTIPQLAAAYAEALIRAHPFADGNKRTAWVLARLFLALNGHALKFDPQDATRIVLALAAGELSEEELTDWFRDHLA